MADEIEKARSDVSGERAEEFALALLDQQEDLVRFFGRWVSDPSTVDDLCQEAILRAFRYRHKFQTGSEIRPWLHTIAFRVRADWYRKHKRRRDTTPLSDDPVDCAPSPSFEDETSDPAEADDDLQLSADAKSLSPNVRGVLDRALSELRPVDRILLEVAMENIDYEEAAALIRRVEPTRSTDPNALHQALFRAKLRLKQRIYEILEDADDADR